MTRFKKLPSFELVDEFIDYNPLTGCATWKKSPSRNAPINSSVGCIFKGYLVIGFKGNTYAAHRIFWLLHNCVDPGSMIVDHIDGNKLNNKVSNLRLATDSENQMNRSVTVRSKSGIKGVCWDPYAEKYKAFIKHNNKAIHIGLFTTQEKAFEARQAKEVELFGSFSRQSA
jgi:hypothetical protein